MLQSLTRRTFPLSSKPKIYVSSRCFPRFFSTRSVGSLNGEGSRAMRNETRRGDRGTDGNFSSRKRRLCPFNFKGRKMKYCYHVICEWFLNWSVISRYAVHYHDNCRDGQIITGMTIAFWFVIMQQSLDGIALLSPLASFYPDFVSIVAFNSLFNFFLLLRNVFSLM